MRREEVITTSRTVTVITCDFCGGRAAKVQPCVICGKDVCYDTCGCPVGWDRCLDFHSYYHDHSIYVCNECWRKGRNIARQIQAMRSKADVDERQLWKDWKEIVRIEGGHEE